MSRWRFPDGSALFFGSDHQGHHPIFRVALGSDAAGDEVTKLTRAGHYSSVTVSPDGARLYALRDHIDSPPTAVWLDATAVDGEPHVIPSPGQVGLEVQGPTPSSSIFYSNFGLDT